MPVLIWWGEIGHYLSPAQKLAGKGGNRLKSAVKRLLTVKRRGKKVP